MWQHIKKGVPLRVEIGPRDMAEDKVVVSRRDTGEKELVARAAFVETLPSGLQADPGQHLRRGPWRSREANTRAIDDREEFIRLLHAARTKKSRKSTAASRSATTPKIRR